MSVLQKFTLQGKTALVTGCKRGIGKAMAVALAEAGANIIGVSASLETKGSEVEKEVLATGRKFTAYQCDFGNREALYNFIATVRKDFPVIDILVNNAGTIMRKPAAEHPDEYWDEVIAIYELAFKEALYIGKGNKEVVFASADAKTPARFYINSTPAHMQYPTRRITRAEAEVVTLGSLETANHRTINKLLVNSVLPTCQLQMGMTELKPGSIWNTMPAHTHDRRMEVYFYFEIPEGQSVCHFWGQPQETRHIWMQNNEAVISPPWSIHSGAGTSNYTFIWGMAGENLDYGDMDHVAIPDLR